MGYDILMFSYYFPPQYSGAAKQALALARVLRSRGHHIEFATVRWPGLAEWDQVEGFRVWRLEQGRGRRHTEFRLWWNLFRFTMGRRGWFDVIHSHGASYRNAVVGPLARLVGARSVVKGTLARDDLAGVGRGAAGRLHGWMLRQVNACVAISSDLSDEFRAAGVEPGRIWQIPNGVNTRRFRPVDSAEERRDMRQELGLPPDRPVVLAVWVFDQRKNLGWLMETWVRHGGFGTGALLVTVGPQAREDVDGSFLARLDELAADYPDLLSRRDLVSHVELYYRAADLFVLPSHSEGLPNVVLEAMACGLPCVVSAVSGSGDLVEHGVTGWQFPPGDETALGRAVQAALGPDGGSAGRLARCRVLERYAIERVTDRYEALYVHLLGMGCGEDRCVI